MGGLLHFFDFNQSSMARKVFRHKKRVGGHEAPRNSLELQAESSGTHCSTGDIPYSYQVEQDWSGKNSYQIEASMKKLINEEISNKRSTRQNAPSIVARLMGMDMLPADKSFIQPTEKKVESIGNGYLKNEKHGYASVSHLPSNSNSSRKTELDSFYQNNERDSDRWSDVQKLVKIRPKEHPQEEELQKFKIEFEAFQASKFRECSRDVELSSIPRKLHAQENLNKENLEIYANSRKIGSKKPVEPKGTIVKTRFHEGGGLQHPGDKLELFPAYTKEPVFGKRRTLSGQFELSHSLSMDSEQKLDKSSAPPRIVILKPGPDRIFNNEASCSSSLGTLERGSMEEFLEEVKERLNCELQGKIIKKGAVARGRGIETPFREKPSEPKYLTHHTGKQVRDSVTRRDPGVNLLRSESTRSYGSEVQFNEPGSPEFMDRDARRFLSERLRNVLKRETLTDIPVKVSGNSRSSLLDNRGKRQERSLKSRSEVSYWEIVRDGQDMQTRSFRYGADENRVLQSPRNLVRSLSAPVSGTSFGKLLLEDRHIITGAQIRRKHEAIENLLIDKKQKKERFKFKEKVSNFRYSLTLRGKLFGRKIESVEELCSSRLDSVNDIMSGPTVMNCNELHENSTEVPPTPASVCSSAQEEFWRPTEYITPILTPDVTTGDDSTMQQVFREISSNLNELRKQLNQLESDRPEETRDTHDSVESEMELEDWAEAYIRDLLVSSGFYDGSYEKSLSRWDPHAKFISNSVFNNVEESYKKLAKDNESCAKDTTKVDHKVLLDLLNEALSTVFGPPITMSKFRRKIIGCSMLPAPLGNKLLNCVWDIIHIYLYPQHGRFNNSVDDIVARDLKCTNWSGLIDDENITLGGEIECLMTADLVSEIVKEMKL